MAGEGQSEFVRHIPKELLEGLKSRILHYVAEAKDFSATIKQVEGQPPQLVLSLGTKPEKAESCARGLDASDHERTNTIIVKNIPTSLDEEFLELFFESAKKKGGGPVKQVKLDREGNWASIEFFEPEAVDIVLAKQPITMLGTVVDIQPYAPLLPDGASIESLGIQGLPKDLTDDLLASHLDSIISPASEKDNADEISSAPDEKVKETVSDIESLHLKYLQESDFEKMMKEKYPTMIITTEPAQKKIVLDGHASDVHLAKKDIYAYVERLRIHEVNTISTTCLAIFQSSYAKKYINKVLKSLNSFAVWEVNKDKLTVCCFEESVSLCYKIVMDSVKEVIVTIPADSSVLLSCDLWDEHLKDIDMRYEGLCRVCPTDDKSGVTVAATNNVFQALVHAVQTFFIQHQIIRQVLTLTYSPYSPFSTVADRKQAFGNACKILSKHLLQSQLLMEVRVSDQEHKVLYTVTGTAKGLELLKSSKQKYLCFQ